MEIFVIHDGERLGPLSVNDLRLKIDNGTLRPDDYAWVTGMKDWQTISQVLETATRPEAIEANPPPSRQTPKLFRPALAWRSFVRRIVLGQFILGQPWTVLRRQCFGGSQERKSIFA